MWSTDDDETKNERFIEDYKFPLTTTLNTLQRATLHEKNLFSMPFLLTTL
jgi:hypothetical protein